MFPVAAMAASRARLILACVLTLLAAASAAAPARADAHAPQRGEVIVRLAGGHSAGDGRAAIRRHGGRVTGELHLIHGLVARLPASATDALRGEPAVAAVTRNARMEPTSIPSKDIRTAYPFSTGATSVWNSGSSPATGRGIGVAVIDTGIAGRAS